MLEIVERITEGQGKLEDIDTLETLGETIKISSLCGLGQSAPNPVLSTIHYFRDEYEAHCGEKRCPAGQCKDLVEYYITEECTGCTLCARNCPVSCISGKVREIHVIDQKDCTKCGNCKEVCKFDAVITR